MVETSYPEAAEIAPEKAAGANRGALIYLLLGTMLFALGAPVLKLLMIAAGRLGLNDPRSLSFCNVLFVGNMCAGLVTLAAAGPARVIREVGQLQTRIKVLLGFAAVFSTIYPALLFTALQRTSVINIVLVSRFNGIVYVALAFVLLRTMVDRSELLGYAIMAVGVVILLATNASGGIRSGDVYVLIATVFFALTEVVSKKILPHCSIASYVFVRNFVSSLIFFILGVVLFGAEHFGHAFAGDLWILMLFYSGVAIVAAQLLWLRAVRVLPVQTIANTQLLNPLFSLMFAFLLLGETPSAGQGLAIGVVALGMAVQFVGHRRSARMMQMDTGLVAR